MDFLDLLILRMPDVCQTYVRRMPDRSRSQYNNRHTNETYRKANETYRNANETYRKANETYRNANAVR